MLFLFFICVWDFQGVQILQILFIDVHVRGLKKNIDDEEQWCKRHKSPHMRGT
ncbi:hypothetical protein HanHA89_Chr08g0316411 [Helianthus annuus]|nr:hypothetical protein HanHA89_Chr08g0316411 [Helianthus annuus]